jgi:VWFA-related protein
LVRDANGPPPALVTVDGLALVQPGITVPSSGDARFRDRRLLILLFDLSDPYGPDQQRMFDGARTYLERQMTAADLVAIMTLRNGAVRVKQDFTDDRKKLGAVIDVQEHGEDADGDGVLDFQDFSSAFGQDDQEFNVFGTDRKLAALQSAVTMLRPLPEQKSLVFFTSRLALNGTDNNAQMRATTNAAIRANVQIFPVDARGLVAMAPLGNANQRSPGGTGMFTGVLAQQAITRFQKSQDVLFALAKDTGGKAFVDYNDLSVGVQQAASAQTSYYIIGFYSSHTEKDGKYRRVDVKLADRGLEAELAFRPGYYADKEWAKQNRVERERQLEEALMLEDPITDITIALELNYFQISRSEYFLPVSAKIPGSELELAKRRAAEQPRRDDHPADRRQGRTAGHASGALRDRLHAVTRQVLDQAARARRRDWKNRHLPDGVHHPESEQGADAAADQHSGARRPADSGQRSDLPRQDVRQGKRRSPSDRGWSEAATQRDASVQRLARHALLSRGL